MFRINKNRPAQFNRKLPFEAMMAIMNYHSFISFFDTPFANRGGTIG